MENGKAEEHWEFIEGIINHMLPLIEFLFIEGMKHGMKHGKENKDE